MITKPTKSFTLGVLFGTRPEAIKIARLVHLYRKRPEKLVVISTGQHAEMLRPILEFFKITPDVDLQLMKPNQTVSDIVWSTIKGLEELGSQIKLDGLFVQGDTASCMAGSLWAFLTKIPVFHIEAGLRSGNLDQPWPEEFNRRVTAQATRLHFAPTKRAQNNLLREGFDPNSIFVVGNTVIDSLQYALSAILSQPELVKYPEKERIIQWQEQGYKIVLVTVHRRESIGQEMRQIFRAIRRISERSDVKVVLPLHLNPQVQSVANEILLDSKVWIIPPVPYLPFIDLMQRARFILSDSGGIQEEAPSLKKPVLVLRKTTERPEGVEAGVCELVGTDEERIVERANFLLDHDSYIEKIAKIQNPYGDGTSSEQIIKHVTNFLS